MSSGHQSFDMIEFTVAHNNKEHAAASYAALYEKLQKYLFFYAFGYSSPSIYKRVKVLREIQLEYDQLEEEFLKERAALEAKYQKLYQAFYAKRCEIVNGLLQLDGDLMKDKEEKGIPNFWLTAMKNNDVIADEIFDKDEGALRYLKDIKWSKTENPKGFKLDFFFNTNPFFKNSVLTKVYHMIDEDEPILEKATGTGIEWYPGKCLTLNIKKEGNIVAKIEHCKSFFNFFSPPPVPAQRSDIDDAIADKLKKHMEQDYDVGITIKDKIIPRAISWFTGDAQRIGHKPTKDNEEEEYEDGDYNGQYSMRM